MASVEQQRQGREWLNQLLSLATLPAAVDADGVAIREDESCWLTISSDALSTEQIQALQGDRGEVLDSIQYLLNTTLNMGKPEGEQQPFTVELDGYRDRRQAELLALAEEAAAKVRETGEEFEMVALSAAERRQVHTFLKDYEDLETSSRGQEPDRRLVVRRK
ncbi:RNA-binding protein [Thermoleptolyngbya oregonensis NK1-22]|uniref:RNA-binding protein n=1 Tax=Thermoleptolyngbya oregonensis NK1-22 TaxID=2547457 RepID=A0AA96Y2A1_9CYAN|nr:R3H domain-containing nucleic acid-binding protein [Thermoleptolyngbya sp. M55_K2018_002]WOB41864.1 RNA-binding protein [Thermoleptolyngbya oregonensis NK1-22]HIK39703.1 RNA-binding protein [Thermoleptolyngbya sp. M55_K2018_002]